MNEIKSISYSGTNVTTSAYVALGTPTTIPTNNLFVSDSSGQLLKLAASIGAPVAAVAATLLNQTITYTARVAGAPGNKIKIILLDPAGNSQALSVTVSNLVITVHLATDSGGAITSTAGQVATAINASTAAHNLVTASAATPAQVLTALSSTALANGADATNAIVDLFQMPVDGDIILPLPSSSTLPIGSQLYLEAISATANTGNGVVTLLS